ncbi:MAG: M28 family peptidase [Bacteroidota bacterium]
MRFRLLLCLCFLGLMNAHAQNAAPEVQVLSAGFDLGTNEFVVQCDLTDAETDTVTLVVQVSVDSGRTFPAEGIRLSQVITNTGPQFVRFSWPPVPNPLITRLRVMAYDKNAPDIAAMVAAVDSQRLLDNLTWIAAVRHRTAGPVQLEAVKDSLENRFSASGYQVRRQNFPFGSFTGQNIIGRAQGLLQDTVTYILDGHFDSVPTSPGANDNGASVAALVEISRVLSQYTFANSIQYIGFDLEEDGLVGAINYLRSGRISGDSIHGVLNLEMIGYYDNRPNTQQLPAGFNLLLPTVYQQIAQDSFRGNFIANVGNTASQRLIDAFQTEAANYVPNLISYGVPIPGNGQIAPDFRRSDHAPFWDVGIPALMLTSGADFRDPNYHGPNDTLGNVDIRFAREVAQAALATLATLAEPINGTAEVTEFTLGRNLSIQNRLDPQAVALFPNPGSSSFFLDTDLRVEAVNVYDTQGKLVKQFHAHKQSRYPTKDLPNGMYVVQVQTSEGTWTGKWIKG